MWEGQAGESKNILRASASNLLSTFNCFARENVRSAVADVAGITSKSWQIVQISDIRCLSSAVFFIQMVYNVKQQT